MNIGGVRPTSRTKRLVLARPFCQVGEPVSVNPEPPQHDQPLSLTDPGYSRSARRRRTEEIAGVDDEQEDDQPDESPSADAVPR